jgi:hypothetical protein
MTTPWYQLSLNAKAITSLFTAPPTLDQICLCCIELERENSRLRLRFDLEQFPDRPPAKWSRERYNMAQLTVDFFDIKELRIENWGFKNRAHLTIIGAENQLSVLAQGDECSLHFICDVFRIAHISGYWLPEQ